MVEQGQSVASVQLAGSIPVGRGLMPEELAEFKAKGREWSRLYKEKRRKEFSAEQVEERKLKNRLRQKRFRERQKSREQEEAVRLAASLHQQQLAEPQHHHQQGHQHAPQQQEYDPSRQMQYGNPAQSHSGKMDDDAEDAMAVDHHHDHHDPHDPHSQQHETLVEKRKRLGRERQARFREKKRVRTTPGGSGVDIQTGMTSGGSQHHHEIMTLTELQKMSAQLSGYYTGLTQGLSQEEHQAVMRYFLENIREELGDEVFGAQYTMADVQAHAAAQAQYLASGQQSLDLHALQAAAAAHMPQQDLHAQLQAHAGAQVEGHLPPQHLHEHLEHAAHLAGASSAALTPGELTPSQLDAYHRQLAEHQAQQAGLGAGQHQAEAYMSPQKPHQAQAEGQHIPGEEHAAQQQGMMYGQPGVPQEMSGLHYGHPNPEPQ